MIYYAAGSTNRSRTIRATSIDVGVPTTAKLIILLDSILFNYISIVAVRPECY